MDGLTSRIVIPATVACAFLMGIVALLLAAPDASAATRPDLEVLRMTGAPNPAYVGNEITYTVVVKNNGPGEARTADLYVTMPPNVRFLSAKSSAGCSGPEVIESAGTVTCSVNNLAKGDLRTIKIVLVPVTSGSKPASARVRLKVGTRDVNDSQPGNDSKTLRGPFKEPGTNVRGRDCDLIGDANAESLPGTTGNDVICGLGGGDTISGLDGDDFIYGGVGDDTIDAGAGNDFIRGGLNDDEIAGGNGDDTVSYADGLASRNVDLDCKDNRDSAGLPTPCADPVEGDASDYRQDGRESGLGYDVFTDSIENAMGSHYGDFLVGSALDNTFWGLSGSDVISGEDDERDTGGRGDTVAYDGDDGNDQGYDESGDNEYIKSGKIVGVTIDLSIVNTRQDTRIEGYDTLKEYPAGTPVPSIDNVIGTFTNDILHGNSFDNNLDGSRGNDRLHGLQGNDTLIGGIGKDTLGQYKVGEETVSPEEGDDTLDTQDGVESNDSGNAGSGADTCVKDNGDVVTGCEP